jgi:hypothetical protein
MQSNTTTHSHTGLVPHLISHPIETWLTGRVNSCPDNKKKRNAKQSSIIIIIITTNQWQLAKAIAAVERKRDKKERKKDTQRQKKARERAYSNVTTIAHTLAQHSPNICRGFSLVVHLRGNL